MPVEELNPRVATWRGFGGQVACLAWTEITCRPSTQVDLLVSAELMWWRHMGSLQLGRRSTQGQLEVFPTRNHLRDVYCVRTWHSTVVLSGWRNIQMRDRDVAIDRCT